MLRILTALLGTILIIPLNFIAQNNVGIGTSHPNPQAILDIESTDKGVLISRLTTTARNTLGTALTNAEDGMLVYDKDLTTFFYWDGPNLQWVQVGSGTGDNWGTQVVQTAGANISGDGTVGNPLTVTDNDNDPNNEIELPATANNGEVLTWNGTNWIPQAAPSGADNWGTAVVNSNGTNISGDGTTANPLTVTEVDGDITNEIQDLSLNTATNILSITNNSNASNIDLTPYLDNTDAQTLSLTGNTLTISNGNNVTLTDNVNDADADPSNEIELPTGGNNGQVLSTNGSGEYTWVDDDAGTDNQNINGSSLNGTTLTIGIERGSSETVNLSPLQDNLGNHTATQNINLTTNKLVGNGGNTGISIQNDGHTKIENLPQYSLATDRKHVVADNSGNLHSVSFIELRCALGIPTEVSDVMNPTTGRTWMDRNLGASRIAITRTDELAYGDLYQWGRDSDGHHCRNSSSTNTNSSTSNPSHGDFVIETTTPFDWRVPQNNNLWQGVNGINNPCPKGYRLPTATELNEERLSWSGGNNSVGAFGSPLKFTTAGYRDPSNGAINYIGNIGYYWSSTITGLSSRCLSIYNTSAGIDTYNRATGFSVRCIKN
ncbi:MAG: fibrobacter succinogenes major paralogous domain-containing protein [Flavobacteriales bacterium]|jgi:uncharacterized protein (TIGR02145 family)|nr:fibrobacter succinogenes major paralogous domain-containing protein [Flavobacteriales bacterium]